MKTKYNAIGLAVIAVLFAQVAQADQQVTSGFQLPVQVDAVINETGCQNSPGPTITLGGKIKLGV